MSFRQPARTWTHSRQDRGGASVAIGLTAGLLAASAVVAYIQSRHAEREHPPPGRFIDVDGVRLHYIEKGTGSAVLLLHGAGVTAEDYVASGLVDRLSQRYRVIAFDRPGYGYSNRPAGRAWTARAQADLLEQACVALGMDRVIVVGHSWGTLIALEMAMEYPARVLGLVLVSGYYFPTPRLDSLILATPAIPVFGQLMRHTVSPLFGRLLTPRMIRRMFAPGPVPQDFATAVPLPLMLRPGQLRASAQDAGRMVPTALALNRRYGELRMPTVILAGAGDEIVKPDGQSMRLEKQLAHGELEVIPDAGHMLHHSHADRVSDAVNRVSLVGPYHVVAQEPLQPAGNTEAAEH
jgi:pimeloyl-ACP methyl ester carboxylesterase